MGDILKKYYDSVQQKGGIPALCKMALKTGITAMSAKDLPDSPDNVAKVKKAFQEIMPGQLMPMP